MSLFSEWSTKAKTYYDEKVKPDGGTGKSFFDAGKRLVTKAYNERWTPGKTPAYAESHATQQIRGILSDQLNPLRSAAASAVEGTKPGQSAEDLLYGSRRGIQGRRKSGKSNSEDLRRTPYAMKNDTLLTQGQKAKKLKGKV